MGPSTEPTWYAATFTGNMDHDDFHQQRMFVYCRPGKIGIKSLRHISTENRCWRADNRGLSFALKMQNRPRGYLIMRSESEATIAIGLPHLV